MQRSTRFTFGLVICGGQYGYIIVSKLGLHHTPAHSPICISYKEQTHANPRNVHTQTIIKYRLKNKDTCQSG